MASNFNLSLTCTGRRNSHHICSRSLRYPSRYEGICQGERAQEESKGALPPLIYLLLLAQTAHSGEDAPKSNSHPQHGSCLSEEAAKGE